MKLRVFQSIWKFLRLESHFSYRDEIVAMIQVSNILNNNVLIIVASGYVVDVESGYMGNIVS